jgi:serine/threonine-protein kinase
VAELATGGMATVYLGRLSGAGGFQRFVGIKRLHPHLAREPEFIEMFLDEARLAARIHHPNVVPILEIGTSEQGYYIVMEYVEGDTLANLIARSVQGGRRVPVHVATRIIVDVLAGLHAAHELADDDGTPLGIVHRDVSPQNILIGIDGSARLTDFGVARATSRLSTTRTGQLKGKLAYMAPEQARGVKDIDRRADIFAAGVVFWEALEGRRLFKGDGEADTLNKVLNEPIPPLRSADPSVPHEIEGVLERALDRERVRRFPTASAFADALERAANEVGEVATHKDVAAYLDDVLGPDLVKHRETVRGLIARGEPSRPKSISMPPPAVSASSLPRPAQRPLSPEPTDASGQSVGSAVISNHLLPRAIVPVPPPSEPPAPHRGRVWIWGVLVGVVLVAAVGLMRIPGSSDDPTTLTRKGAASSMDPESLPPPSPPAASAPAATAPTPSAATDAVPPADSEAASRVEPSARPPASVPRGPSSAASSTPGVPAARPHPVRLSPSSASSPAPVPDDISRNPYR